VFVECPVCFAQALTVPPYETWPPLIGVEILKPPYEDVLRSPSYEVCPSCGFEFGNDDNPGTAPPVSFAKFRQQWIEAGRPLFADGRFMPEGATCPLHRETG
jgi:hypothetical protein